MTKSDIWDVIRSMPVSAVQVGPNNRSDRLLIREAVIKDGKVVAIRKMPSIVTTNAGPPDG